jgi:hypothetical protein
LKGVVVPHRHDVRLENSINIFFFSFLILFSAQNSLAVILAVTQEVKILWPFFIIISDGNFSTHTEKVATADL